MKLREMVLKMLNYFVKEAKKIENYKEWAFNKSVDNIFEYGRLNIGRFDMQDYHNGMYDLIIGGDNVMTVYYYKNGKSYIKFHEYMGLTLQDINELTYIGQRLIDINDLR